MSDRDDPFQTDLIALVPQLRAFGKTLAGDPAAGDDLAQEAMLKAWQARDSFTPGTNLKAWVFMILRNLFYSDMRRAWRRQPLDPEVAERTLVAADDAHATLELSDLRRAMMMLSDDQREALILVGAAGLSYEEAAEVTGSAVGTVKSRVSRARAHLIILLAEGDLPDSDVLPSQAFAAIMRDVAGLRTAA
jgi:RNA polymerase sigma-70 factor (ECF subfamily)